MRNRPNCKAHIFRTGSVNPTHNLHEYNKNLNGLDPHATPTFITINNYAAWL